MRILKRISLFLGIIVVAVGALVAGLAFKWWPDSWDRQMISYLQQNPVRYRLLLEKFPRLGLSEAAHSVLVRLSKQQQIDKKLLAEFQSGGYTLEKPFLMLDPYGIAPLSALLYFETEEPVRVTLHIAGTAANTSVTHEFAKEGYCRKHLLPVYGLYADKENVITVSCRNQQGQSRTQQLRLQTEKLTGYVAEGQRKILVYQQDKYQPGMNFSSSSVACAGIKHAFDAEGQVRWIFTDRCLFSGNSFDEGRHIYRVYGQNDQGTPLGAVVTQESLLGRIEALYYIPLGEHHEIRVTPEKTLLVGTNHWETAEDGLLELDLKTGKQLLSVDYDRLLPRQRRVGSYHLRNTADWAHINSMVRYQDEYISSSNFQSAVFRHSPKGEIRWLLSDPEAYPEKWQQYLLKPLG